ncbi:transglycosylase SLT domain-containing protein [Chloroflexi bacterium TSY]|nr:transglycosylase SLT domain-containing protein [Chloroflexi bacterium TSY]
MFFVTACDRTGKQASTPVATAITQTLPEPLVTSQNESRLSKTTTSARNPLASATDPIATDQNPNSRPASLAVSTPTETPSSTVPETVEQILQRAQRSFFHGDTVTARTHLSKLLNSDSVDSTSQQVIERLLARTYLADNLYTNALAVLDESSDEIRVTFLRARAFSALGRYLESIAEYEKMLNAYSWTAETAHAKIAANYLLLGNGLRAAEAYAKAADATNNVVSHVRLLEAQAQAYRSIGRYDNAAMVYDEILTIAKNRGYRAEIQYRAGQAYASAGNEALAIERWQSATKEAPENRHAYQALIELINRNSDFDLYDRGYIDLQAAAWLPAINAFQRYLDSVLSTDERADLAMHGLGLAHLGNKNYPTAVTVFERLLDAYPDCTCIGQVWLDIGRAQAAMGNSVGARRTYRTFARTHSNNELAAEALWRSGFSALSEGNQLEAAADLIALADRFPYSTRATQALYFIGLGAFSNGLTSQAISTFTRLQQEYPDYRPDAVGYWLGRGYLAQNEHSKVEQLWQTLAPIYRDTYYGILIAQYLDESTGSPMLSGLESDSIVDSVKQVSRFASQLPGDDGSQAFAESWLSTWITKTVSVDKLDQVPDQVKNEPEYRLGLLLLAVDERLEALSLLERIYDRYREQPNILYPLSLEFEKIGAFRLSLLAMETVLRLSPATFVEESPIFLQQRIYPRRFKELVEKEAVENGLDPLLMFSLIRQESLFEKEARSYAAAQGLAQIIPDTGQWVADRLAYPNYSNDLLYRPYVNIKFGAYYLRWASDFLDNNRTSALVGYNAGPGNSKAWRTQSGSDDAIFVEILSVNEPRIYVKRIVTALYHYHRLYDQ